MKFLNLNHRHPQVCQHRARWVLDLAELIHLARPARRWVSFEEWKRVHFLGQRVSDVTAERALYRLFSELRDSHGVELKIGTTSDNGLEMGAHRIEFKDYLYEEGERVPLIIRGPGFPAGVTRDQLVSNIDLAPTITSLTKVRPARVMDGIPLLPLAQNPSVAANRDLLFESYDIGGFGIRSGPWVSCS